MNLSLRILSTCGMAIAVLALMKTHRKIVTLQWRAAHRWIITLEYSGIDQLEHSSRRPPASDSTGCGKSTNVILSEAKNLSVHWT
jgi:predicted mannosyl-3-phosphoglycerate phosphatase (HAD superfamily)